MKTKHQSLVVLTAATLVVAFNPVANACSRILWNNNPLAVIAGRTMDWPESTLPIITVLPAGMARNGGMAGPEQAVKENPAKWTSKYGSLVTTIYGIGTADGVNEKGLAGHMLYLKATDFGPRDATKSGVQAGLWLQYLLDQAADVKEALALLEKVQIVMVSTHGHNANVHLAIEDIGGLRHH
jgi:choloylglycine hydrolase